MNQASLQRLAANYQILAPNMAALAERFYDRLFKALPEARPLFKIDIALQSQHLAAALALIVRNLTLLDALEQPLMELGVHHARVGVRPEHYPFVCRAMVQTLGEGSGEQWSRELEADWTAIFERISRIMMDGALAAATSRDEVGSANKVLE